MLANIINLIINIAVKWLFTINHIQNKKFLFT